MFNPACEAVPVFLFSAVNKPGELFNSQTKWKTLSCNEQVENATKMF